MRKMAQERKRNSSPSASTTSNYLCTHSESPLDATATKKEEDGTPLMAEPGHREDEDGVKVYPMEQIWNDIASLEIGGGSNFDQHKDERSNLLYDPPAMASPVHEPLVDNLWMIDDHDFSKIATTNDFLFLSSGMVKSSRIN